MSRMFEQLDLRQTPIGEVSVRRRFDVTLNVDVHEVKLGDEFLMSSLFTVAEVALADLGLAAVADDGPLDVVVGGLGLGYTARAALADERVASMYVVDYLEAVIDWHASGLLPLSADLNADARCHYSHGNFFGLVADGQPFGAGCPDKVHAILVDIDHTPRHLLHPSHAPFYEAGGLARLADRLHPGGVYGLWSDDPPDLDYLAVVEQVFGACHAHEVTFPNPFTGGTAMNTVYVAVKD